MSAVSDFRPGLEGVIAFETEIAEPDKDGGSLRYRGVDIEELVGHYPFENVWGLLVDEDINSPLPPTEAIHLQDPSGSVPADLQAALATLGPKWGIQKLVDIDDKQARDDLARLSSATLTIVAQAARGRQAPVPESEIEQGENAAAKFLIRGAARPTRGGQGARHLLDLRRRARPQRLDLHGAHRSLDRRRLRRRAVVRGRHASGPLHGGAPARVLPMIDGAAESGDPEKYVRDLLDRGERIMGFGHRVYRAYDPRATRAQAHRARARLAARRGRGGARGGSTEGAAREVARPPARDERRVLGRSRARHRGDPRRPDARDVRLRARRRLVCAHPRAEADRPPRQAAARCIGPGATLAVRRRAVTPKKSVQLSGIVVAESSVSSIDPDAGVLMYRGYDIADIAEHSTYEDTAYLLLHGELPDAAARDAFAQALAKRALSPATQRGDRRVGETASPMDLLRTAVSTMSFGSDGQGSIDREAGIAAATRVIAQMPTAIARHHRLRQGLDPVEPDASLSYAENFLTMLSRRAAERAPRAHLRHRDDPARGARDERVHVHRARRRRDGRRHDGRDRRRRSLR